MNGIVRTEAEYFDSTKYKLGNALLFSVHGQRLLSGRVALDLGIDGRYARADESTDASGAVDRAVANTGGTVLSIAPGVYVNPGSRAWLFIRGQIPFYKDLFGDQNVLPSFTAGLQFQVL